MNRCVPREVFPIWKLISPNMARLLRRRHAELEFRFDARGVQAPVGPGTFAARSLENGTESANPAAAGRSSRAGAGRRCSEG